MNNSLSRFGNVWTRIKTYNNWYVLTWPLNRLNGSAKILETKNGMRIFVRNIFGNDFVVTHEMFSRDDYQVSSLSPQSAEPVILDLGANIGAFTVFAAGLYSKARIFSYEPAETNFRTLIKNIELNNLQ